MAITEPINIEQIKCYKCKRFIKQAAHRIHSGWFCVACWHYIKINGLIHLYESELEPYDWDLARKEQKLNNAERSEHIYDDSDFFNW